MKNSVVLVLFSAFFAAVCGWRQAMPPTTLSWQASHLQFSAVKNTKKIDRPAIPFPEQFKRNRNFLLFSQSAEPAAAVKYGQEDDNSSVKQRMVDYVNANLANELKDFCLKYTELDEEASKANAWSAGAYTIVSAEAISVSNDNIRIKAAISKRSFFGKVTTMDREVDLSLLSKVSDAANLEGLPFTPNRVKIALLRLCLDMGNWKSTGTVVKMPFGFNPGLPKNLRLNNVPHSTLARTLIFNGTAEAVLDAIEIGLALGDGESASKLRAGGQVEMGMDTYKYNRRMRVVCTVPESNPAFDTYRVGTILEMIREIAMSIAEQNLRVRICIQGSMGEGIFTGMPLALNGMRQIMERMDWQGFAPDFAQPPPPAAAKAKTEAQGKAATSRTMAVVAAAGGGQAQAQGQGQAPPPKMSLKDALAYADAQLAESKKQQQQGQSQGQQQQQGRQEVIVIPNAPSLAGGGGGTSDSDSGSGSAPAAAPTPSVGTGRGGARSRKGRGGRTGPPKVGGSTEEQQEQQAEQQQQQQEEGDGDDFTTRAGIIAADKRAQQAALDAPQYVIDEARSRLVQFGAIGPQEVREEDDVFFLIAPQSIVGGSIYEPLRDMVRAAGDRPVILFNPNLKDRPSSNNKMQVRGRSERNAFAESFTDIYNFRLLYRSSTSMFPILGAVYKPYPTAPYVIYRRVEGAGNTEEYVPVAASIEDPDPGLITKVLEAAAAEAEG